MKAGLAIAIFGWLCANASAWTIISPTTMSTAAEAIATTSNRRGFLDTVCKVVPLVLVTQPTLAAADDDVVVEAEPPAAPAPPPAAKKTVDYNVGAISLDDERGPPPPPRDVVDYSVGKVYLGDEKAAPPPAPVEEEEPPPLEPEESLDENEFIATLKARSIANKEKNKKLSERTDKLSVNAFRSQYNRPSFVGVRDPDQTDRVTMVLKEDFDKMFADGKVRQTYESKISKKTGELSDDYTRPIFVYVK